MAQFVGGRYQLIAQLGGGGMADVFLAKLMGKSEFAKLAVVKRLKAAEDEDPEITSMFADEARLSARLNHPSIVQTFEVGEDEGGPFLVMEYIEGQPLGRIRSRAARRGLPIPRAMALKMIRETVGALAYAHNLLDHDGSMLKVVHRDVSPENIMVTYAGLTKLVDFGVAKTTASMSKTRAGVLKGKVAYMAPEQARSDENIDERVDVFAIGLILWELLTARRLWEGMSEAKVFERLLDKEPLARATTADPTIPEELDEICAKAIAKDRDLRYATASDLLDALEGVCSKLNLRASDREIGQFVSALFEVEREKVKALVTGSMARKDELPTGIEESDPLLWRGLSSGSLSQSLLLSSKSEIASKSGETPAGIVSGSSGLIVQPAKPSALKRIGTVAAVLAVVAGAVVVGTRLSPHPSPTPATPPVAVPVPTPTPSAEAPTEVTIDITAKPANARIFVDGKPVAGNPHHLKATRNGDNHEIRVEADGHESRSMMLAFDRDRAVDLNLVKSNSPTVVYIPGPTAKATAQAPTAAAAPSTSAAAPSTSAAAPSTSAPPPSAPATTGRGISELDPTKPKSGAKQDKIDTDVFKR